MHITLFFKKNLFLEKALWLLSVTIIALLLALSLWPEQPAKPLTPKQGWKVMGAANVRKSLITFPEKILLLRRSVVKSSDGVLFRTWTPTGVVPLEVASPPFHPTNYMSVVITGSTRTTEGKVHAIIQCESNGQTLPIFQGNVYGDVVESILAPPVDWCPGYARVKLSAMEKGINVGIGAVFEISYLSYLKSSFIGRIIYFLAAINIFGFVMLAGASLATRLKWFRDSIPVALVSLGATSLFSFYITSAVPTGWRWFAPACVFVVASLTLALVGREALNSAMRSLKPYARVWIGASLIYFTISGLVYNGLGHWEPNYRFWPAIWSSDNVLPWKFAEAMRHGWDLKKLFGIWMPTDRPPLMTGAHLLVADVFDLLQEGNDGFYLRGQAYNSVAITLNALWVPVSWWLLTTFHRSLDDRNRTAILMLVGCIPFTLFNTVYGWPKAFGAALALASFGMAWRTRINDQFESRLSTIILFFVLGALSMLAHASTALFLAPLGLMFLWWSLRDNTLNILIGFGVALILLASWSLFKSIVLTSNDPVTKYALTGDYGFDHPDWTLWYMLSRLYASLDFCQWFEIKKTMLLQAFFPLHHSIAQIGLNSDCCTNTIDKLRAWDFMLLSKGNFALPFLVVLAIWITVNNFFLHSQNLISRNTPFLTLIGISLVSWLLIIIVFIAPVVIHIWPQAALFGLALGGAVIVHDRYPVIFGMTLLAMMTYTGFVWILSPINSAMSIDTGAGIVLVAIVSWALISLKLQLELAYQ